MHTPEIKLVEDLDPTCVQLAHGFRQWGYFLILLFFIIEKKYYSENHWIVYTGLLLFLLIAWGSRYTAILTRQLHQRQISLAQIAGASLEFLFLVSFIWFYNPMFVFTLSFLFRFCRLLWTLLLFYK
ncbi:MAG: hypothetical protein IPM92_13125 [Saprospiraceae bacterium]|nr:hypothetical protein [Saprospiraceae bacterium]